jgi:putative oxidoreductase
MLKKLLATNGDWTSTVLRIAAGIMIFPHGLQKTFGWFGGAGLTGQMNGFSQFMHIPALLAFLAIMAEFLGGIGLILGLFTRIAAFGVACNMVMAVYFLHWKIGFFMNWGGKQMGEGFEFHLLAVAILVVLIAKGGGPASVDRMIAKK